MSVVRIKKTYNSMKLGKITKTKRFEIIGNAPYVENFVLKKKKRK